MFHRDDVKMFKNSSGKTRNRQLVVSLQSFEDFDVIMVDKSSDRENCCRCVFNNNIDSFLRLFPLKVLYTRKTGRARKRKTNIRHYHVISMVCTPIENSS